MYLRICMKTKFRQLHFMGRSTLHKISEFYLSDHGRQPQFGQNAILAHSEAKIRNWKIINCFYIYICSKPFSGTKNEGKLFLVPKSSEPLLAGLPLKLHCCNSFSVACSHGDSNAFFAPYLLVTSSRRRACALAASKSRCIGSGRGSELCLESNATCSSVTPLDKRFCRLS